MKKFEDLKKDFVNEKNIQGKINIIKTMMNLFDEKNKTHLDFFNENQEIVNSSIKDIQSEVKKLKSIKSLSKLYSEKTNDVLSIEEQLEMCSTDYERKVIISILIDNSKEHELIQFSHVLDKYKPLLYQIALES